MSNSDPHVARLGLLDACAVSDALDKLGLPGCVTGLRSALPGQRIAGRVHTVKLKAGSPPADRLPVHLGAAAIDASSEGDVIVVEQSTGIDAGCWGGILSRAAKQKGVVGVICEGLARDVDEAREIGFPIFCRGYTARTALSMPCAIPARPSSLRRTISGPCSTPPKRSPAGKRR
jgi:4-hydroxy-4-methyl-2-oxoglutarate aldolase